MHHRHIFTAEASLPFSPTVPLVLASGNIPSKTGTLFDADLLKKLQCDTYHFSVNMSDIPDECRACGVKSVCQGGCPHDKLLLTGTRYGKSVLCDVHKEIIPRLKYLGGS